MHSLVFFTGSLVLSLAAHAATVEYWWNISYVKDVNPSGLQSRRAIGVNGTWPLPPVSVTQGDTLIIHAYNGLGDVGTALHSHGIYFNGSSYYDGAVGVSQCPIPPGETLSYTIPTDLQSGTYWIHGHYNGQYVDGLRTPLVIYPANGSTYQYDEDLTIVVADWYNDEHSVLMKTFMSEFNPRGTEPIPTAPLLYIFPNNSFPADCPDGECIRNGTSVGNNATLYFQRGKKYRLRFINMSALAMFYFGIDGHYIQVIELDGTETEPFDATMIPLSVAQRVSILVTARNDSNSSVDFPLKANMNPDMFDHVPDDLQMNITARVTYVTEGGKSTYPLDPPTVYNSYPDFVQTDLVPIDVEGMAPASVSHRLDVFFVTYDDGINHASFNNVTYVAPLVPSIITTLSMPANDSWITAVTDSKIPKNQAYIKEFGGTTYATIYGAQTHAIPLEWDGMIEVVIYNWDSGLHPFHLHGHKFQIVQVNYDATQGIPINETQVNPIRRDTVMVPPGGSTTIRFRADNPGVWFFHCHIEWHLESGLAVVFLEAPAQAQAKLKMPQQMLEHCARQNIPMSGNVVGKNSTTDFAGQPFGPFPQAHILGWTPTAKGALAGTILSALIGLFTIAWYSTASLDEDEIEEVQRKKFAQKLAKKETGFFSGLRSRIRSE